jgi:hypothetical protein
VIAVVKPPLSKPVQNSSRDLDAKLEAIWAAGWLFAHCLVGLSETPPGSTAGNS